MCLGTLSDAANPRHWPAFTGCTICCRGIGVHRFLATLSSVFTAANIGCNENANLLLQQRPAIQRMLLKSLW